MAQEVADTQEQRNQQLNYKVIFDTNAILSVKWSHGATIEFKNSFQSDQRLDLELIVFKPVFDEWRKRYEETISNLLEKNKGNVDQLNKLLDLKLSKAELKPEDITKRSEDYINKIGFKVVDADVSKFPTLEFFERANNQKPPFQAQDKGFKDAVIATATFAYIEATPSVNYLVLCNDDVLCEYLIEKTKALKNVKIVKNLDEAGSQLNLALSNLDEQLGDKAKTKFANTKNESGIFYDLDITEKLTALYFQEYPNGEAVANSEMVTKPNRDVRGILTQTYLIPNASNWRPINMVIKILDTTFIKREDSKLYWDSTISLTQGYRLEYTSSNIILDSPGTVEHTVIFEVSWSTDENNGEDYFVNPQLVGEPRKIHDNVHYYPSDSFNASMAQLAATRASNTISGMQSISGVRYDDPNDIKYGAGSNFQSSGSVLDDILSKIEPDDSSELRM